MKSVRHALLALVVGLGLVAMAPTPTAVAATGGSVTGTNGVLYDGCHDWAFRYAVDPSAHSWSLDIEVFDPRGVSSTGAYLFDGANPSSGTATGDDRFLICDYEPAGRYTIRATVEYCDSDWSCHTESLPVSSFTMRKPYTRTGVSVSDRTATYGQLLTFKVVSRLEFPNGYFANRYQRVLLQKRTGSGWVTFSRLETGYYGTMRVRVRWPHHRGLAVRAVTLTTPQYRGSFSGNVWVS